LGAVNAVGRRLRSQNDPSSWAEVIGVVRDTGTGDFDDDVIDPIPPPYYVSYTQSDTLPTTILARTSGDAAAPLATIQRELRAVDVTLPVITARTMAQAIEGSQAAPKAVATFLAALGGLGLVLASIGLYSASRLSWRGDRVRSASAWRSAPAVSRSCRASREEWRD
jgi:hypothetical protein